MRALPLSRPSALTAPTVPPSVAALLRATRGARRAAPVVLG